MQAKLFEAESSLGCSPGAWEIIIEQIHHRLNQSPSAVIATCSHHETAYRAEDGDVRFAASALVVFFFEDSMEN
jgi:hypothetical protein